MKPTNLNIPTPQIADFCRKWKVAEFALFGSILRKDFRPDSDVDVLVSFAEGAKWNLWDLIQMQEELKTIFGREITLIEKRALRNPFRRYEILSTKEVLYAA